MGSTKNFLRRCLTAILLGVPVGAVGFAFHHVTEAAAAFRLAHPWILLFLPAAGASIVLLYHICGRDGDKGTDQVLITLREDEPMHLRVAPLIFITTAITHLVGGSSGREGAALQLGASIASRISKALGFDTQDSRIFTACGMAAGFSALFGTPLAAALFSLGVLNVGSIPHAALAPALLSSLTGWLVSSTLGSHPTAYLLSGVPALSPLTLLLALILGLACGLVARLFCLIMHDSHFLYDRFFPNPYLRAAAGGALVLAATLAVGAVHGDLLGPSLYNGTGGELIDAAISGAAVAPWAFLLKILFTALTLGAGFKGGEIVPTFATGAAFGCALAPLLGLSSSFGAGLGMAALFCGVTNCPLTSMLLAYELFGGEGLPLIALAVAASDFSSGYCSLYTQQSFRCSKEDLSEKEYTL